jgi:hypothetical protein
MDKFEATQAESKSGLPMFREKFPGRRITNPPISCLTALHAR